MFSAYFENNAGAGLPPRDSYLSSLCLLLITVSVCAFVPLAQASHPVTLTYYRYVHFSSQRQYVLLYRWRKPPAS